MDLLAFEPNDMYYAEPIDPRAEQLIEQASAAYGDPQAEEHLHAAQAIEPNHLVVFVALYRYYFYRHSYATALSVAVDALREVADRLNLPKKWQDVTLKDLEMHMHNSAELVRFYLHTLKGAGYLLLRLNEADSGLERLDKVSQLDPKDRIGAKALADVAREALQNSAAY